MSYQERWDQNYKKLKELESTWADPQGTWGDQYGGWDSYEGDDEADWAA